MNTKTVETIAHVILEVILIATFIVIFFFTYVSKVEGEIVKKQMYHIVDNLTGDIDLVVSKDNKAKIAVLMNAIIRPPDMSAQDAAVEEQNKKLLKKSAILFGIINVIGIAVIIFLWKKYKIDIKHLLISGLLVILFVAITEFCFVTLITKNYNVVDPNYVKYLIFKNLQKTQ